jgi:protein-disulfide isomerase
MGNGQEPVRRERLLRVAAGAVFLTIVAVAVLIVVNSSRSGGGDAENLEDVGAVNRHLAGIPQRGLTLGGANAKVELIEYGDLQCPVCKAFAEEILEPVVDHQVKEGSVKVVYRNFPIVGPQSSPAGTAALAAGAQGRGWQFLELFYRNQGLENSGYADDGFLTAVARAAGVRDVARWNRERNGEKFRAEVEASAEEAERLGLTGTPSLAIRGPKTDGVELLGSPSSAQGLEEAIEAAA